MDTRPGHTIDALTDECIRRPTDHHRRCCAAYRAGHTGGVRYDELMDAVENTSPLDWVVLSPPTLTKVMTSGEDAPEVWQAGHESVAYLRSNLDISVAWGAEQHDGRPWEGAWGEWSTFPDRSVYGLYAEIAWCSRPIHRQVLAAVDGFRHYLPAPNAVMAADNRRIEKWVVERDELPLARLVDGLVHHGSNLDTTLRTAGLEIRG